MSTQEDLVRELRNMQEQIAQKLLELENGSAINTTAGSSSSDHNARYTSVDQSGASVHGTTSQNGTESTIYTSTDRSVSLPVGVPGTSSLYRSGTASLNPGLNHLSFGLGLSPLDTAAPRQIPLVSQPGTAFADNIAIHQRSRMTPSLPMFRGISGNSRKIAKPKSVQLMKQLPKPVKLFERKFICMNEPDPQAPTDYMLKELEKCGLGRKNIEIDASATSEEVQKAIECRFPRELSTVPWRIMKRCQGGPVARFLIKFDAEHNIPKMETLKNSKPGFHFYIQPEYKLFQNDSESESETGEEFATNHEVSNIHEMGSYRSTSPATSFTRWSRSSTPDRDFSPFADEMQERISLSFVNHSAIQEQVSSIADTREDSTSSEIDGSADLNMVGMDVYRQEIYAPANPTVQIGSPTFRWGKDVSPKLSIRLNRETLLEDTLSILRSETFDVMITPVIEFVGEAGVDSGALLKDWLWKGHQLLAQGVWRGANIFDGYEDHRVPSYDCNLLQDGIFEAVARFGVLSLLHLNIGIPYLSRSCVDYFTTKNYTFKSPIEIHGNDLSAEAREAVKLIQRLQNGETILPEDRMEVIKVADNAGYRGAVNQATAANVVDVISRHDVVNRRLPQLNAMKKIFLDSGVVDYLQRNPGQLRKAFPLIADLLPPVSELLDMIVPILVEGKVPEVVDTTCKWMKEFIVRNQKEPAELQNLLCAWTGSGLMPSQKIKLRVYLGTKFEFHACFNKLEIPPDLTRTLFRRYIEEAILPVAGFHLI